MLPSHLLLADPGAHTTDLMTLRGVRLGIIEELPEERTLKRDAGSRSPPRRSSPPG